jgi:hypothetical protein
MQNVNAHLAFQRARFNTAKARADRALGRLGGETASRRPVPNLEDMTAEQIERDTASIKKIMGIWRLIGKRTPVPYHASEREEDRPERVRDRSRPTRERAWASSPSAWWRCSVISGYDRPAEIRAVLAALKHERQHIYDARHLATIEEQERIFTAALAEMEAKGITDDEPPPNPKFGAGWVGSLEHQYTQSMRR